MIIRKSILLRVLRFFLVILALNLLVIPRMLLAVSPSAPPVPTLIWPKNHERTYLGKPVIKGLTKNDTSVEVFIDGQLNGLATVKNGKEGTASFAYVPFLRLKPGNHTVSVRALSKDKQVKSRISAQRNLEVEKPYPAPTIFQPVVKENTSSTKPFIVGIALSGSLIKVFIDEQLNGQFRLQSENSVASFAYQPYLDLDPAKSHLVYVTATSTSGKESAYSNVIGFSVQTENLAQAQEKSKVLGIEDANKQKTAAPVSENKQGTPEEKSTTTEKEAEQTKEEKQSTIVWWVILGIVVVIVAVNIWGRTRKEKPTGLKGLAELTKKDETGPPKNSSADSTFEQQSLLKQDKSEFNPKASGEKKMPPPPPPSRG